MWYYYEQNKANCTTKIQPLAVFVKKCGSIIYRHSINEPAGYTLASHSFVRKAITSSGIVVPYPSQRID
jgi:hypothetical protein